MMRFFSAVKRPRKEKPQPAPGAQQGTGLPKCALPAALAGAAVVAVVIVGLVASRSGTREDADERSRSAVAAAPKGGEAGPGDKPSARTAGKSTAGSTTRKTSHPPRLVLLWPEAERKGAVLRIDNKPIDLATGPVVSDVAHVELDVSAGKHGSTATCPRNPGFPTGSPWTGGRTPGRRGAKPPQRTSLRRPPGASET